MSCSGQQITWVTIELLFLTIFISSCWEDFYWNCFEERFCYDESIGEFFEPKGLVSALALIWAVGGYG